MSNRVLCNTTISPTHRIVPGTVISEPDLSDPMPETQTAPLIDFNKYRLEQRRRQLDAGYRRNHPIKPEPPRAA